MARSLTVRDATLADAEAITERLRRRDYDEVVASVGLDIAGAIRASIAASPGLCWTAESHRPAFVIGCARVSDDTGSPWLLGTDDVTAYPGALTKIAKRHIAIMLQTYDTLVNFVDARNADSVGWLRLLGFTVAEPVPFGPQGLPFHPFVMRKV